MEISQFQIIIIEPMAMVQKYFCWGELKKKKVQFQIKISAQISRYMYTVFGSDNL